MSAITMKYAFTGAMTLLGAALVTAGCSLAPQYKVPEAPNSAAFKEAPTATAIAETQGELGTWKIAQPSDQTPRGNWWVIFDDSTLNALEDQALSANQSVAAAAARVKEARAIQQVTHADLLPTIGAGFGQPGKRLRLPHFSSPTA